jgi:hypothetical protein
VIWFEIENGQHLADLIVQGLAGDQQQAYSPPPGQLPVAGKQNSILGPR